MDMMKILGFSFGKKQMRQYKDILANNKNICQENYQRYNYNDVIVTSETLNMTSQI